VSENNNFTPIYNYQSLPPEPYAPREPHRYQKAGGWQVIIEVSILISCLVVGWLVGFRHPSRLGGPLRIIAVLDLFPLSMWTRKTNFLTGRHMMFIAGFLVIPVYLLISGVEAMPDIQLTLLTLALHVSIFILSRLYYTRSVRVRTYMGTDAYITQCPFTKKVTPPTPAVPDEVQNIEQEERKHVNSR